MSDHGTWASYQRGCREECCKTASRNYQKRRAYDMQRGVPRMVPSVGTERRIHALEAIGWDREEIGRRLGRSRAWVQQVLRGNPRVWRETAKRVAELYDELAWMEPEPSTRIERLVVNRTKNRARLAGWAPPSAWFGVDIDDPAAEPDPGWRPRGYGQISHAIEDFDWLVEQGESDESAAARVGVALSTIESYRRRVQRREEGAA